MVELTPEQKKLIDARLGVMGKATCDDTTINAATALTKEMQQNADVRNYVYSVLPQDIWTATKPDGSLKLDLDCQEVKGNSGSRISTHEVEAAIIAAARIANHQGIAMKDVTMDQVVSGVENLHSSKATEVLAQINKEGTGQCEIKR